MIIDSSAILATLFAEEDLALTYMNVLSAGDV